MQKKLLSFVSLVMIDLLGLLLSLFIAYELRVQAGDIFELSPLHIESFQHLYWFLFLYIVVFAIEGFYTERKPFWEQTREFVKVFTTIMLLLFATVSFLQMPYSFSRSYIVLFWAVSLIVIPLCRFYGKRILYKLGVWNEPLIIMGINDESKTTADDLSKNSYLGYDVMGFLYYDDDMSALKEVETTQGSYPVLGSCHDYEHIAKREHAYVVLIALLDIGAKNLSDLVVHLQRVARRILFVPQNKAIALQNTQLLHLFSRQSFLLEINNNLKKYINTATKQGFDYVAAILLLPFLLPILAIIAVYIKLDSRGPVFFVQERLGKHNKNFQCIKFRTMHTDGDAILEKYLSENPEAAHEYKVYKKLREYDPRVTKAGNFLRKTSLDELAQIFNVLRGEMSLVGPRPYLPREREDMGEYAELILEAAPGITGLWQISGRNDLEFDKRVKLDVWYVLNWSLWSDIAILLKTVKVVLKREGAY